MPKVFHFVIFLLLIQNATAASQLLATFDYDAQESFTSDQPCTMFTSTIAHSGVHTLGDILLTPWPPPFQWDTGFTGTYDLTISLDFPPFDNYSRMIESITDGVDEPMFFDGTIDGCNRLLPHSPFIMESTVFNARSDLVGGEISWIRVVVNSLQIEEVGTMTDYQLSLSYEFWGTPVPEPATLTLLCIAGFARQLRRIHQEAANGTAVRQGSLSSAIQQSAA
jgi:hypothetical protein